MLLMPEGENLIVEVDLRVDEGCLLRQNRPPPFSDFEAARWSKARQLNSRALPLREYVTIERLPRQISALTSNRGSQSSDYPKYSQAKAGKSWTPFGDSLR